MTEIDASGWHEISVRVYYEDTDFSGVVYHANYLRFAERGRSHYLRALGIEHRALAALDTPIAFVVTKMDIAFLQPARIDDELCVRTRFFDVRGARLHAEQLICRGQDIIWQANVVAASVDFSGRPRRLPRDMLARFL